MYLYSKDISSEINLNIMSENKNFILDANFVDRNINLNQNSQNKENIWKLEIKKISLEAIISEGTTKEILDKYIGHFEETSKKIGNIGLAAHNRGYKVNYFEKLKFLKEGDEIKYKYNEFEMTYEVKKNIIIKDTDWKYLENEEEENKITLITCIENEPNYRRCVQAVEKEESEVIY